MNEPREELITREPAVAGQFYPGNSVALRNELRTLFNNAKVVVDRNQTLVIIAPHAGYVYSGNTAANAYIQLDPDKEYENVFIIGSSHTTSFDGASIYSSGPFETPLGIVPVNLDLARELISKYDFFNSRTDAHTYEHSIEVQLPFLQHYLRKPFNIIPIVIATHKQSTCRKISEALLPFMKSPNLFIISTDFSHYPQYNDAVRIDRETAEAIASNNPETFLETINRNENSGIDNLATSICGWTSVLSLMYMTEKMNHITYIPVTYRNSGDALNYGDKSRVVGYYAIAVTQDSAQQNGPDQNQDFHLSEKDKKDLLSVARNTIESYVRNGKIPDLETSQYSDNLTKPTGAFVTLHKRGELRGCIGRFNADIPLYKVVQEMTVSAASHDYRFTPVRSSELNNIKIEVSVLTPLKRITSIDEITLGKHGIYIKKGQNSGTYLPQVADNTGWTIEEFLGNCSRDKAGIGWDGWKEAELYTYEALIFEEP